MRNIFRSFVLCVVFCGTLRTKPSQDIESLSPLARSYFAIETKTIKGGILFSDFLKALYAKCPNTYMYTKYFHGGYGDTIKVSIALAFSELLKKVYFNVVSYG
ncbi:hypothetical protein [Helicobacter equorum]|uniref:hypothetical protein n=1 Tax=Helicobacter equorum TaxID=361872 RepID=UPI000CF0812D|nr:hypothetical protein [Helicobacter equorum]